VTHQQLEFYLDRKNVFGFNTHNDDEKVGWILLSKKLPTAKFAEWVEESEDRWGYRRQRRIEQEPYWITMEEVTRAVFECDRFPTEQGYLLKINYSFATLADVDRFLSELGYSLSEIKWGADVDFL
jgi:hypothetical protein